MANLHGICQEACKVRLTVEELQNIANKICKAQNLEENWTPSETQIKDTRAFRDFMLHLYDAATIPSLRKEVEGSFHRSDFNVDHELILETFRLLTLFQMRFQSDDQHVFSSADKHMFVTVAIVLIYEHAKNDNLWSTSPTNSCGQVLLAKLCQLFDTSCVSNVLGCRNDQRNTVFKGIMLLLNRKLTRKNWKKNPASVLCFYLLLQEAGSSQVSECLTEVFPPVLLLLDDFELENKILGVKSAHCIMNKTSKTELRWFGRADVLFSAVHHLLYSKEDQLLSTLIPCLLALSQIIDSENPTNYMQQSKLDEVFQIYLTNMDFESNWCNRRIYALHLGNWISALGLGTLKHFSRLFKVLGNYLEVVDYPDEETRLNILSALQILINTAWPRISRHVSSLMKTLLKIVIDFSEKDSIINSESKKQLLLKIKSVIHLLSCVDKTSVLKILSSVQEIEVLPGESRHAIIEIQSSLKLD